MSHRALLVQSLLGHLALLQQKYPRKAKSPVVKAMRKCLCPETGTATCGRVRAKAA